jgi:serine/threonine protein phosphatase 1
MIYAIGDIHGCLDSLKQLVEKVNPNLEDKVIFLGDYIDRGPDSKGVVEFLLRFSTTHKNTIFIKGNHEWMIKKFYETRSREDWELWEYNGARKTLESYGNNIENIPIEHLKFFEKTKLYHVEGRYLFVHGGVKPGINLSDQKAEDILWIRDEFIYSEKPLNGYTVVFGHTPMHKPLIESDKIGIDTGCVYGGSLTCLRLDDKKIFQVRCRK